MRLPGSATHRVHGHESSVCKARRKDAPDKERVSPGESTSDREAIQKKRRPMSEETKRRIAASKRGKQQTEETKQKISDAMKRRTLSIGHRFRIAESKRGRCHSPDTREKIARAVSSTKTMLKKQRLAERAASVAAAATADLRPAFFDSGIQEEEDDLILDTIELEKAVIEVTMLRDQLTLWMEAYENKHGRKPDLTETSESHPHVYGRFVRYVALREIVRQSSMRIGSSPAIWN